MRSTSPWHLKKGENPPHTLSQTAGMQFFISKSIIFSREASLLQLTVYLNILERIVLFIFFMWATCGHGHTPQKWPIYLNGGCTLLFKRGYFFSFF